MPEDEHVNNNIKFPYLESRFAEDLNNIRDLVLKKGSKKMFVHFKSYKDIDHVNES